MYGYIHEAPLSVPCDGWYEYQNRGKPLRTKQKGIDILHDPLWNKGMAFGTEERDRLNLRGLLPPKVKVLEDQVSRIMTQIRAEGEGTEASPVVQPIDAVPSRKTRSSYRRAVRPFPSTTEARSDAQICLWRQSRSPRDEEAR